MHHQSSDRQHQENGILLEAAWGCLSCLAKHFKGLQAMRKAADLLLFLCLMTTCKSKNGFSKRSLLPFSHYFRFLFAFWDQMRLDKAEKAIPTINKWLKVVKSNSRCIKMGNASIQNRWKLIKSKLDKREKQESSSLRARLSEVWSGPGLGLFLRTWTWTSMLGPQM